MKERDTIWRYLFRKSGFGRTGWVEFAVIAMAVVMMGGYAEDLGCRYHGFITVEASGQESFGGDLAQRLQPHAVALDARGT